MAHLVQPAHDPNSVPEPKDLIDLKVLLGWALLCLAFIKKRKWIPVVAVFVMGLAAVGALKVIPKTFSSQTRLLAQKNEYLSPDRGGLTEGAAEVLRRRENIANMVRTTNLVEEWKQRRSRLGRIKDEIVATLIYRMTDEDLEEMLAAMVEDRMIVEADRDTISLEVQWNDPEIAFRLVNAAQRAFLEERHIQEISLLAESTGILEGHAAKLEKEINESIENIQAVIDRKKAEAKAEAEAEAEEAEEEVETKVVRIAPPPQPKKEMIPVIDEADLARISEIKVMLEAKERALSNLTGSQQQRLQELHARLAQQRAIYKDAHPAITDLKQEIFTAQQDSPMVARLRSEIDSLRSEKEALEGRKVQAADTEVGAGAEPGRYARLQARVLKDLDETPGIDPRAPEIEFARSQLGFAVRKYHDTLRQIDRERLDLEKAQAAFKHRYRVVTPAEVEKKPIKPKPAKVIIGALLGGLAFGLFLAIALELRRGVIHEPWQLESSLELPVVATIELTAGDPQRST